MWQSFRWPSRQIRAIACASTAGFLCNVPFDACGSHWHSDATQRTDMPLYELLLSSATMHWAQEVHGATHQSLSNSTRRLALMRLSPAPPARADSKHTCRYERRSSGFIVSWNVAT